MIILVALAAGEVKDVEEVKGKTGNTKAAEEEHREH
jgi:hypothetical protein